MLSLLPAPTLLSMADNTCNKTTVTNKKVRVIKKYPNRRLYDTEISRYITLTDVRDLIIESVDFKIVDSDSEEDLTRNTLLQIIMEQENGGQPLFTTEILSRMIRYYGNSLQSAFTTYLENSVDLFAEQQKQLQDQMHGVFNTNPMQRMTEIMHKNIEMWRDMQQNVSPTAKSNTPSDKAKKT